MITIHLKGKDVKRNIKRSRILVKLLPKRAYYHFLFEPELIIRVYDRDKHYISDFLDKKKWVYETYRYPFSKKAGAWGTGKGYGEDKKSMTYIYRDEFIPLMNLESKLALKSKKKDQAFIIERYYHTFLNALGSSWKYEAQITNWLLMGRVNTIRHYEGDGAIVTVICTLIIFFSKVNRLLLRGLS